MKIFGKSSASNVHQPATTVVDQLIFSYIEGQKQLTINYVEGLAKALKDEQMSVREKAAKALGNLRDDRAMVLLIQALHDSDDEVRRTVVESLK